MANIDPKTIAHHRCGNNFYQLQHEAIGTLFEIERRTWRQMKPFPHGLRNEDSAPAVHLDGCHVRVTRPTRFALLVPGSTPTVTLFERFRMDRDAVDLRKALFDAVFERDRDVMDLRDRQVALHRAVARRQDAVVDLADADVVAVH